MWWFFIVGLSTGLVTTWLGERLICAIKPLREKFWDNPKIIFGYHIHHSAIGLLLIVIGLIDLMVQPSRAIFMIGFGVGVIAVHTQTDGRLIFFEKKDKEV